MRPCIFVRLLGRLGWGWNARKLEMGVGHISYHIIKQKTYIIMVFICHVSYIIMIIICYHHWSCIMYLGYVSLKIVILVGIEITINKVITASIIKVVTKDGCVFKNTSLDFTLVSKWVSEWVLVSNLRHLSLYTLDKRHRTVIKDQGRVMSSCHHVILSSCHHVILSSVACKFVSFQLAHLGACELV